jgi:nucleotide-binding universal stress UspA family protein
MEAGEPNNNHWIVAGVDGSAEAERGLQWALEEARLRGAGVRVVTAWHVPLAAYTGHGASPPAGVSLEDEIRQTAETIAKTAAKKAGEEAGVAVETRVVEGRPAEVLMENCRGAELLVLGSRPESMLTGLLTSSVTVQCALHAPAPTAIIR